MAYDSKTSQGNPVNANLNKAYQDYVIEAQSSGQPSVSYDEWYRQNVANQVRESQTSNMKFY
jgi:hypothetical protein